MGGHPRVSDMATTCNVSYYAHVAAIHVLWAMTVALLIGIQYSVCYTACMYVYYIITQSLWLHMHVCMYVCVCCPSWCSSGSSYLTNIEVGHDSMWTSQNDSPSLHIWDREDGTLSKILHCDSIINTMCVCGSTSVWHE